MRFNPKAQPDKTQVRDLRSKDAKRKAAKAVLAKKASQKPLAFSKAQGAGDIDLDWASYNSATSGGSPAKTASKSEASTNYIRQPSAPAKPSTRRIVLKAKKAKKKAAVKAKVTKKNPFPPIRNAQKKKTLATIKKAKTKAAIKKVKVTTKSLSNADGSVIDLGKEGGVWKHGFIPVNAAAARIKAHGYGKGGPSSPLSARPKGTFERGPSSASSSNPRVASNPKVISYDPKKGPSNADKIKHAETMFGTGSPQHLAAKKRFG